MRNDLLAWNLNTLSKICKNTREQTNCSFSCKCSRRIWSSCSSTSLLVVTMYQGASYNELKTGNFSQVNKNYFLERFILFKLIISNCSNFVCLGYS